MTSRNITAYAFPLFVASFFAFCATNAPARADAETYSLGGVHSPESEADWADKSLEDLEEALAAARTELVSVRRERIQVRHDLEQNDEKASQLLTEMDELRRRLNEIDLEWNAWLAEQEELNKLGKLEEKRLRKLRELTAVIEEKQQRNETEAE